MKKSRFTDSQIMDVLKRAEAGIKVPDLCRELGISSALFYRWRAKYGGMDVSMMCRIRRRAGCGTTTMNAQTWPWAASPPISSWPWPRNATSDGR